MDYIESIWVKDYFSVAYEQYQKGQAESSFNSLMLWLVLRWQSLV